MEAMREKYGVETQHGITYVRAEVAADNYERDLGVVREKFMQFLEDHWLKVALGTYFAYRLGILRAIWNSGVSLGQKAIRTGRKMIAWGMDNKLAAFLIMAGSGVALWAGLRAVRNLKSPENLGKLATACSDEAIRIALGATNQIDGAALAEVSTYGARAGKITTDIGSWVWGGIVAVKDTLSESVPEILKLKQEEVITNRHLKTFDELRQSLATSERSVIGDRLFIENGMQLPTKYKDAQDALDVYEHLYILNRCQEPEENQEPYVDGDGTTLEQSYDNLLAALQEVHVTFTKGDDDVVTWKCEQPYIEDNQVKWAADPSEPVRDFGIHHSVTDRDTLYELSSNLYSGEASLEFVASAAIQKYREFLQNNSDNPLTSWIGNDAIAMVAGHFVCIFDPDVAWEYIMVPIDLAGDFLNDDMNGREFAASYASASVITGMVSISAGTLARLRGLAIGGGPVVKPTRIGRIVDTVASFTPGVGHYRVAMDMYRGLQDTQMLLPNKLGPIRGRYINNVLKGAGRRGVGIRPSWIGEVENATTLKQLRSIARRIGRTNLGGTTVETARANLKQIIIDQLNLVEVREMRAGFKNMRVADGADIYDEVASLYRTGSDIDTVLSNLDGLTPEEILRLRGSTPKHALDAGHSLEDVVKAIAGMDDLDPAVRAAHYGSLLDEGKQASQLVDAGADLGEVCTAVNKLDDASKSVHLIDLMDNSGKLPSQLLDAGMSADDLCRTINTIDDVDLRILAFDDLLNAGNLKPSALLDAGANLDDITKIIQSADDTTRVGMIDDVLKYGKASVEDLYKAGIKQADILAAAPDAADELRRLDLDDLARAINQLGDADGPARVAKFGELLGEGRTPSQLIDAGADVDSLTKAIAQLDDAARIAHYEDLLSVTRLPSMLVDAGADLGEIVTVINKADEATRTAWLSDLLVNDKLPAQLGNAGADTADICKAINTIGDVDVRGQMIDDLLKSGKSVEDLFNAGALTDDILRVKPDAVDELRRLGATIPDTFTPPPAGSGTPGGTGTGGTPDPTRPRLNLDDPDELGRAVDALPDEWRTALDDIMRSKIKAGLDDSVTRSLGANFDRAAARCHQLGLSLDDTKRLINNPTAFSMLARGQSTIPDTEMSRILQTVVDSAENSRQIGKAFQRVSTFFSSFGHNADIPAQLLDSKVIAALAKTDAHHTAVGRLFNSTNGRQMLRTANPDDVVKAIEGMSRWAKASNLARITHLGFAGLDVAMLAVDVMTYVDMRERLSKTIDGLEDSLKSAGFEKQGDRWVHPGTKAEVELKALEANIDSMSDPQLARIGADVAGLPLLVPCLSFGPAGIAIGAVVIIAHVGITMWEQEKHRDFMEQTPTPVLAALSTASTIGMGEEEIVAAASNGMISDIFHSSGENERQKELFRKKALAILFFREMMKMQSQFPGVVNYVMEGKDLGGFLDDQNGRFFTQDFDKIIKPYLAVRFFQMSNDNDVQWSEFRELKIDAGWFDAQNISDADMHIALRDSVFIYMQHLQEEAYQRQVLAQRQRERAQGDTSSPLEAEYQISNRAQAENENILSQNRTTHTGDEIALGVPVSSLAIRPDGKTRAQLIVEAYYARLDNLQRGMETRWRPIGGPLAGGPPIPQTVMANRTREEILAQNPNVFNVTLPAGVLPKREGNERTVSIRNIATVALEREATPETMKASYELVSGKGLAVWQKLETVTVAGRGPWFAGKDHFLELDAYSKILAMNSSMDPDSWMRNRIATLRRYDWDNVYPGSEYSGRRNRAFRSVVLDLSLFLDTLNGRWSEYSGYELPPADADEHPLVTPVGREREIYNLRNRSEVYVVVEKTVDGEKVAEEKGPFRAVDGENVTHDVPPFGTLVCRSSHFMRRGRRVPTYNWYFTAQNADMDGKRFTIYSRQTSEYRDLIHEAVGNLDLQKHIEDDGSVYYTREGYGGKYIPQPDGTIYWTGGSTPNGNKAAMTYTLGHWSELTYDGWRTRSRSKWRDLPRFEGTQMPGTTIEIEKVENINQPLPEGQDWYIYPHHRYSLQIELTDGTVINTGNQRSGPARLTDAEKQQLEGLVSIEPVTEVDTSQRIHWRGDYWQWRENFKGWKVTVLDKAKVKSMKFGSNALNNTDREGQTETIDVANSEFGEQPERNHNMMLPATLDHNENRYLDPRFGFIQIPGSKFDITLTLADGRTVHGTETFNGELFRYLDFRPLDTKEYPDGERIPADKQGWKVRFLNRAALRSITVHYPGASDNEKFDWTYQLEEDPNKINIGQLGLQPSEDGTYYTREGHEGKFYVRDGMVYWTGGKKEGSDTEYQPQIWYGNRWTVTREAPSGSTATFGARYQKLRITCWSEEPGDPTVVELDPDKDIPTVPGLSISRTEDGRWRVTSSPEVAHFIVQDMESDASSVYSIQQREAVSADTEGEDGDVPVPESAELMNANAAEAGANRMGWLRQGKTMVYTGTQSFNLAVLPVGETEAKTFSITSDNIPLYAEEYFTIKYRNDQWEITPKENAAQFVLQSANNIVRMTVVNEEIGRRLQNLHEAKQTVELTRGADGRFHEEGYDGYYFFDPQGAFVRTSGMKDGQRLPRAVFEDGKWVDVDLGHQATLEPVTPSTVEPEPTPADEERTPKGTEISSFICTTGGTVDIFAGAERAQASTGICTLMDGSTVNFSIAADGSISGAGAEYVEVTEVKDGDHYSTWKAYKGVKLFILKPKGTGLRHLKVTSPNGYRQSIDVVDSMENQSDDGMTHTGETREYTLPRGMELNVPSTADDARIRCVLSDGTEVIYKITSTGGFTDKSYSLEHVSGTESSPSISLAHTTSRPEGSLMDNHNLTLTLSNTNIKEVRLEYEQANVNMVDTYKLGS